MATNLPPPVNAAAAAALGSKIVLVTSFAEWSNDALSGITASQLTLLVNLNNAPDILGTLSVEQIQRLTANAGSGGTGTEIGGAILALKDVNLLAKFVGKDSKGNVYFIADKFSKAQKQDMIGICEYSDLSKITATNAGNLPGFIFQQIKPEDISKLKPGVLGALGPTQVASLRPDTVGALGKNEIAQLKPDAVAGFDGFQAGELSGPALGSFSKEQFEKLSTAALSGLNGDQVGAIGEAASAQSFLSSLKEAQFLALSEAAIQALTPESLVNLFQASQLALFLKNPLLARKLTSAQFAAIGSLAKKTDNITSGISINEGLDLINGMSPAVARILTKGQITALNAMQIRAMGNKVLEFSPTQLSAIGLEGIAALDGLSTPPESWQTPSAVVKGLSPAQIKGLTSSQIGALRTIEGWTGTQVGALSPEQILGLTTEQFTTLAQANLIKNLRLDLMTPGQREQVIISDAKFGSATIAALSTAQIRILLPERISQLSAGSTDAQGVAVETDQVDGLTSTQLAGMTTAQLAAFTPVQIADLTGLQLSGLNATQFKVLTAAGLTSEQIKGLSPTQIANFSPDQVARFGTGLIAALSSEQLAKMTTAQIVKLTTAQVAALSTLALPGLTSLQAAVLSSTACGQVAALSSAQMGVLSGGAAKGLTAAQIALLTAGGTIVDQDGQTIQIETEQVDALTSTLISGLSTKAVKGFSSIQIQDLSSEAQNAFTPGQIAALSPEAVKGFDLTTWGAANVRALTSAQVASLTGAQLKQLAPLSLQALLPAQLKGVGSAQIRDMGTRAANLLSGQIAALSNEVIAQFSSEQIAAMGSGSIAGFTAVKLPLLTSSAIQGLGGSNIKGLAAVSGLSPSQLKALTTAAIQGLQQKQLQAVTPSQLAGLTSEQLAVLTANRFADGDQIDILTAKQIGALSTAAVQGMTEEQLADLTDAQFKGFSLAQVGGLNITYLSSNQITALSVDRIGGLTSSQVANMDAHQIQALTSAQVGVLSFEQISGLGYTQLTALGPKQIEGLTRAQVDAMTQEQRNILGFAVVDRILNQSPFKTEIERVPPSDIKALTPQKVRQMTVGDVSLLSLEQMKALNMSALSPLQLRGLTLDQLKTLDPEKLNTLTPLQIASFSAAQIGSLDASDVATLKPTHIAALSPAQILGLTSEQLGALTPAQIKAMDIYQIQALTPDQLHALTEVQLKALTPVQLGALTTGDSGQIKALSPEMLAQLSPAQLKGFSPSQLAAFDKNQVLGLGAPQLASLSTAQLSGMMLSAREIKLLTPAQVASLTPEALHNLGADLAELTQAQVKLFRPEQIAALGNALALNPDTIAVLGTGQIKGIPEGWMVQFYDRGNWAVLAQLTGRSVTELEGMGRAAVAGLPLQATGSVAGDPMKALLASLTQKQLQGAPDPSSLAKIDPNAFAHLSDAQIATLTGRTLGEVSGLTLDEKKALIPANMSLNNLQTTSIKDLAVVIDFFNRDAEGKVILDANGLPTVNEGEKLAFYQSNPALWDSVLGMPRTSITTTNSTDAGLAMRGSYFLEGQALTREMVVARPPVVSIVEQYIKYPLDNNGKVVIPQGKSLTAIAGINLNDNSDWFQDSATYVINPYCATVRSKISPRSWPLLRSLTVDQINQLKDLEASGGMKEGNTAVSIIADLTGKSEAEVTAAINSPEKISLWPLQEVRLKRTLPDVDAQPLTAPDSAFVKAIQDAIHIGRLDNGVCPYWDELYKTKYTDFNNRSSENELAFAQYIANKYYPQPTKMDDRFNAKELSVLTGMPEATVQAALNDTSAYYAKPQPASLLLYGSVTVTPTTPATNTPKWMDLRLGLGPSYITIDTYNAFVDDLINNPPPDVTKGGIIPVYKPEQAAISAKMQLAILAGTTYESIDAWVKATPEERNVLLFKNSLPAGVPTPVPPTSDLGTLDKSNKMNLFNGTYPLSNSVLAQMLGKTAKEIEKLRETPLDVLDLPINGGKTFLPASILASLFGYPDPVTLAGGKIQGNADLDYGRGGGFGTTGLLEQLFDRNTKLGSLLSDAQIGQLSLAQLAALTSKSVDAIKNLSTAQRKDLEIRSGGMDTEALAALFGLDANAIKHALGMDVTYVTTDPGPPPRAGAVGVANAKAAYALLYGKNGTGGVAQMLLDNSIKLAAGSGNLTLNFISALTGMAIHDLALMTTLGVAKLLSDTAGPTVGISVAGEFMRVEGATNRALGLFAQLVGSDLATIKTAYQVDGAVGLAQYALRFTTGLTDDQVKFLTGRDTLQGIGKADLLGLPLAFTAKDSDSWNITKIRQHGFTSEQIAALTGVALEVVKTKMAGGDNEINAWLKTLPIGVVGAMTLGNALAIMKLSVADLTDSKLQYLTGVASVIGLTPTEVSSLPVIFTTQDVDAWNIANIRKYGFTNAQIAALTETAVGIVDSNMSGTNSDEAINTWLKTLTIKKNKLDAVLAALGKSVAELAENKLQYLTGHSNIAGLTAAEVANLPIIFTAQDVDSWNIANLRRYAFSNEQIAALTGVAVADVTAAMAGTDTQINTWLKGLNIGTMRPDGAWSLRDIATILGLEQDLKGLTLADIAKLPVSVGKTGIQTVESIATLTGRTTAEIMAMTPAQISALPLLLPNPINTDMFTLKQIAALTGYTEEQLKGKTKVDLAKLNLIGDLSYEALEQAGFSRAQIASLLSSVVGINGLDLTDMSVNDINILLQDTVDFLTAAQVAALTAPQIKSLSERQIGDLSPDQLSGLSGTQIAAMSDRQVAALLSLGERSNGVTVRHIQALTKAQVMGLDVARYETKTIASLSAAQIKFLTTAQAESLTSVQAKSLTSAQIASLSAAQIKTFSNDDLDALTVGQFKGFTAAQITVLSSTQVGALLGNTKEYSALTEVMLKALTTANIKGLTQAGLEALTIQQIGSMSAGVKNYVYALLK